MAKKGNNLLWIGAVLLTAALGLGQMSGCGGSSSGNGSTGTLKVALTDKPSDDYAKVIIAIKEVRVVPAGMDDVEDRDSRLPVVVTYSTPHVVDIMKLRNLQQELLGTVVIPAGTYNQVRLILAENPNQGEPVNYVTLNSDPDTKIPLKTPSQQQSGHKVRGKIEVKPGVINSIILDFDPDTAITNEYILKPRGIRIVQVPGTATDFGSLSGTIASFSSWSSATVSVIPQGSSTPTAAGNVFSNVTGSRWEAPYTAFVPVGSYRVHIQATGFAPYSSPVQDIVTGADRALGTAVLIPR